MKVSDTLRGVKRLAFDTAPLIYLVEKHPIYFDPMYALMEKIAEGSLFGSASMMALVEVLVMPIKHANSVLAQEYEDVLLNSTGFQLIPLDVPIARQTAQLRARYNFKVPDALHLATALVSGCDAFITNDLSFQRVTEIRVIMLDSLELDPVSHG